MESGYFYVIEKSNYYFPQHSQPHISSLTKQFNKLSNLQIS